MTRKLSVLCLTFCVVTVSVVVSADEPVEGIYRGWSKAVKFDISPPLRLIPPVETAPSARNLVEPEVGEVFPPGPLEIDPVVQTEVGDRLIPSPIVSFDAQSNLHGVAPPDPAGEVGMNHFVAMSNLAFAIYNKSGGVVQSPRNSNTLWSGFGGDCQTDNDGDPIVLYDQFADRWILTQFTASGPTYFNCVAISTTPDPTGSYYRYAFSTGTNFPDYPKYGVWSNAYFISTREFAGSFVGVGAYAVNRAEMIAGNPSPTMISFLVPPGSFPANVGDGLLPADIDGFTPPPDGSPGYYVGTKDNNQGATADGVTFWTFDADFDDPPSSSFVLAHTLTPEPFDSDFPCSPGSRDCIPQPGTTRKIDMLAARRRPTNRLAYRNFGTHESLVTSQSVEAAPGIAGMRWYEIRDPQGSPPVIHQQGTYGPGASDGIHRWMGSIAMDNGGNMALGFSASDGTSTYPSSWYTGRLSTDPLGTMPQGEGSIIDGTGSQLSSSRWGDYTTMTVDPMDDCTFWYVNQYLPTNSAVGWRLRVGAFKFDECVAQFPGIFYDGFNDGTTDAWSQTNP